MSGREKERNEKNKPEISAETASKDLPEKLDKSEKKSREMAALGEKNLLEKLAGLSIARSTRSGGISQPPQQPSRNITSTSYSGEDSSVKVADDSAYLDRSRGDEISWRIWNQVPPKVLPLLQVKRRYNSELVVAMRNTPQTPEVLALDEFALPKYLTDIYAEFSGSKIKDIKKLATKLRKRGRADNADELLHQYRLLKADVTEIDWNVHEFARGIGSLVDDDGNMLCWGELGLECVSMHMINPYHSVELLMELRNWHLEHLIPQSLIKDALDIIISMGKKVDWNALGRLMFRVGENVVLVRNGMCHPTTARDNMVNMSTLIDFLTDQE